MKQELKKTDLARLYRQFSRQKYNKYRHQFPRMRQSELVSKIIKEWEGLSIEEKGKLFDTYTAEKHISEDKSESSEQQESPGSSKSKKKKKSVSRSASKGHGISSGTPSKKCEVQVFAKSTSSKKQKDQQSESSDFARDGVKKDFEISESSSKELGVKVGAGKKKRIVKQDTHQPKTEYLKFFKFYYEKLTKEHPRWTANQISTIIKLLWKKKQATDKHAAKTSLRAPRERKRMSGRMAFRKAYNYTGIEGAERWKQLPGESKDYWRGKGEGLVSGRRVFATSISGQLIRRRSFDSGITGKSLGFMRRSITSFA